MESRWRFCLAESKQNLLKYSTSLSVSSISVLSRSMSLGKNTSSIDVFVLSPFFFLLFLLFALGCGDSAVGGLPFCWGSKWEAGGGDGEGFDMGGLVRASLIWVRGCCGCCLFPLTHLLLLLSSLRGSEVGVGATLSAGLTRVALVSAVVVGAVPLDFVTSSDLFCNSGALFVTESQDNTLPDCLALFLQPTTGEDVPLKRLTVEVGKLGSLESLFSTGHFEGCCELGWGTGSNLGSFCSGKRRRFLSSCEFPFWRLSRTF